MATKSQGETVPPELIRVRSDITERVYLAARSVYGRRVSMQQICDDLGVSRENWKSYQAGVPIPGLAILAFVAKHDVESGYLLHGTGPMFRADSQKPARSAG